MKRSDRAMMQLICRIQSNEPSTTEILCAKLGLAEICSEVRARRLRWYGHVKRLMATQSSWAYKVSEHKAPGDPGRGAPRMTWSKCVERDFNTCKLWNVDLLDRTRWRERVRVTLNFYNYFFTDFLNIYNSFFTNFKHLLLFSSHLGG